MNGESQATIRVKEHPKVKFFVIFKLIMSIIYFIPSFIFLGLGFITNIFLLIIESGGSKLEDTSGLSASVGIISFFSIIPTLIAIIILVLAIICCVKFFKNNYNKILDLTLCVLLIIVSISYIILLYNLSYVFLSILLYIFMIIIFFNILIIVKYYNN